MSKEYEPSPLLVKTVKLLAPGIFWFGRVVLRWNRLDRIDLIPLEAPMEEVVEEYGEPFESEEDEEFSEGICHTFQVGQFHQAVIKEWKGRACSVTYWSSHPAPLPDLKHMLKEYAGDSGWNDTEPGYWYFRKDGKVRLWCSAVPAIGVATTKYLEAAGEE